MLSFQQEPLEMYHGGIRLIKIHVLLISSGVEPSFLALRNVS